MGDLFLLNIKLLTSFSVLFVIVLLMGSVFAQQYVTGVAEGNYVMYGNFVGVGPGFESFNDYDWLKLEVFNVVNNEVTLLSTGLFKDGTPIPGNGTSTIWNLQTGEENGVPSTQGPIIAANLMQGDAIPPPNTYTLNKTEDRTYLGVSRSVNILDLKIVTPDYESTLNYFYDRASGILLESKSIIIQSQPESFTSEYSYSVIETNIFNAPPVPEFIGVAIVIAGAMVIIAVLMFKKRIK